MNDDTKEFILSALFLAAGVTLAILGIPHWGWFVVIAAIIAII